MDKDRVFEVQLLRLETGEWFESQDRCELSLRPEGLTLRSLPQKSLLADIPRGNTPVYSFYGPVLLVHHLIAAILSMERADTAVLRVNTAALTIALRFTTAQDAERFQDHVESLRIPCTSLGCLSPAGTLLPDLSDPVTQEYLVQLLCSSEFEDFVGKLGSYLDQMRDKF